MSNHRLFAAALAAVVFLAACGAEPELPPAPTGPTPEELEQRRLDSLAQVRAEREAARRAEQERMEREAAREAEENRRTLVETVYFDYDEAAIRSDTEDLLRAKAEILRSNPDVRLRMEGHADERGTSEYNIALGNARAEAVIEFIGGFGLDANRFESVSYGEEQPAAQGSTESAWARNRRVEFVITAGGGNLR